MNLEGVRFARDNDDIVARFKSPGHEINYWFSAVSRDIRERLTALDEVSNRDAFQTPKSITDFREQVNKRTWTFHRGKFRFWGSSHVNTNFSYNQKLRERRYQAHCRGEVLPDPVYPIDIPDDAFGEDEFFMGHDMDMDDGLRRRLEYGCEIIVDE